MDGEMVDEEIAPPTRGETPPATPPAERNRALGAIVLACILAILPALAQEAPLEHFESPTLPSSGEGVRFGVGLPAGWELVLRGERTRAVPPSSSSRREPEVFVEVRAVARDESGMERLLGEAGGLEKWVVALDPRRKKESALQWTIAGKPRDVLIFREARDASISDRRVVATLVEAGDVRFVIMAAAPIAPFDGLLPLFQRFAESFEVRT